MQKLLSLLLLGLLLLSSLQCEEIYEITETELTNLETIIENQKISIEKQQILLQSSNQKIEKLESLTSLSEKIINKQEILLKESEKEDLLTRIGDFFVGLLTGSVILSVVYMISLNN